jgi:hypothetical protein
MRGHWRLLVLMALGPLVGGGTGQAARRGETAPERPAFKVRASPGLAFPPAEVLLTAELQGGADREDFHCPQIEWDFADGSRSVHQEDCEPLTVENPMERRFTRRHAFDAPGEYQVVVTLRRSDRILAQASTTIILEGGATTTSGGRTASASLR